MQVYAWTALPRLISGMWLLLFLHPKSNQKHCNQPARRNPLLGKASEKRTNSQNTTRVSQDNFEVSHVDFVSSNVNYSHQGAMLYIFEDSEAVIKMIIKGRDAFDWLFDRINLDPKIQIKYFDTKLQFADILTKGNFTRDEWNHLLSLFNISMFSSSGCSQAMSKRMQERNGEERIAAKSKPIVSLVSRSFSGSSTVRSSTTSASLESFKANSHGLCLIASTGKPVTARSNEDDGAWNSQEWKTEVRSITSTRIEPNSEFSNWSMELRNRPRFGDTREYNLSAGSFMERVDARLRTMINRLLGEKIDDTDKHSLIWGMFMSSSMNAAVFPGKDWTIYIPSEVQRKNLL